MTKTTRPKTFETYKRADLEHGWRERGGNGRVIAGGMDGFKRSHAGALRAACTALDLRPEDYRPHPTKKHRYIIARSVLL